MFKRKKFMGFTGKDMKLIELSGKRKLKHEKIFVKPVKCGCGTELWYKALRCPGCETTLP